MSLTDDVARLLHAQGCGTYTPGAAGGDIFLSAMPDKPDVAIAVVRYGGPDADPKLPYDRPSVQIRVRGTAGDARDGEDRVQAVYDALHGLGRTTLASGTLLLAATGNQSGPIHLGRDAARRHEWTVNVDLDLHRPTPHRHH